MRAALGGALPLLPLIDETISTISTQVGMPALSEGDNPTLTNEYGGLVLSKVVHLLTALLRGPHIYVVEVARTGAIGMLGHLLGSCPPSFVTPDLLAAMCSLEASLAAHAELSDQVLIHIFLQLQLWARARTAVVPPLLRQLYRLASERPEQWARIEGACRLLDGMQDEFPCRDASLADSQVQGLQLDLRIRALHSSCQAAHHRVHLHCTASFSQSQRAFNFHLCSLLSFMLAYGISDVVFQTRLSI